MSFRELKVGLEILGTTFSIVRTPLEDLRTGFGELKVILTNLEMCFENLKLINKYLIPIPKRVNFIGRSRSAVS